MSRGLSISAFVILIISIILLIIATALPSWVVNGGGFGDGLSAMGGSFYSSFGLFQFCQGFFGQLTCSFYESYTCIGDPITIRICNNRNIGAGLMVTSTVLAFIATVVYGFTAFSLIVNRLFASITLVLTAFSGKRF